MKIRLKDWKGIVTNLDENDAKLEVVRDSVNFEHRRGFLQFAPRDLEERVDMPNLSGYLYSNWEWETGIYTNLTSDRLTTNLTAEPTSYDVLVLICKTVDAGTTHRLIWLHDGTSWREMSNYSSPRYGGIPTIDIGNLLGSTYTKSMFSTTLTGTPFFQVEDGRLKIYLPHMAFWIGRIERKIWITDHARRWPVVVNGVNTYPYMDYETTGYWYIDRLVDKWEYRQQWIDYGEVPMVMPPRDQSGYNPLFLTCGHRNDSEEFAGRRLGIVYDVEADTNGTHTVGQERITVGGPHDNKVRWEMSTQGYQLWSTRCSINNYDTGVGVKCKWLPIEEAPNVWTMPIDTTRTSLGWDYTDPAPININSGQYASIYLLFTEEMAKWFHKYDDDTWTWATSGALEYPNGVIINTPTSSNFLWKEARWSISYQSFLDLIWEYRGGKTVATSGWDASETKCSVIATMLLDEREELPVAVRTYDFELGSETKFAISIKDIQIPYDISKRVTRLRFYHRLEDGSDYEMVKEFDLLSSENIIEDFTFIEDDKEGITLAGNIGYLWDPWEKPQDMRYITGFRSFVTESGISIGLAHNDLVSIFHSTFGGGSLMPDLIYDDNRLPISGIKRLTAVGNADGRLLAFTDNTAYAINPEEVAGVIGFRIEDTIEVGVKNQNDIANIQGGVAVHTIHGIYITNGFETQTISEPIDDIILQYYATGRIYYNRYFHILYYKPTDAEDLYQFRFKDSVWERINKTTTVAEIDPPVEVD